MSIHVLQRKSRRFKAPISGKGNKGFSLNGTHRNVGAVGQTNLAKSVTRTPFRGVNPMGHGGHNGNYVINVSNSGSCCTNDNSFVKTSTKNTKGHIFASFYYPTGQQFNYQVPAGTPNCKCPTIWVQNTSGPNNSQGIYISETATKSAACDLSKTFPVVVRACPTNCGAASYHIGGKKYIRETYTKSIAQNMSQGIYINSGLMAKNCLPTPANKQPFPMNLNHTGCDINWLSAAEAKAAGALPSDWMTAPVESEGR